MKHKILALASLIVICMALTAAKSKDLLQFDRTTYDFGTIYESDRPVDVEYTFTNTDTEPVAILTVNTGCGCVRAKYPTAPVAGGKSGVIKVTFKPKGQSGSINRNIKVRYRGAKAKSSRHITLRLRGRVTPDKE